MLKAPIMLAKIYFCIVVHTNVTLQLRFWRGHLQLYQLPQKKASKSITSITTKRLNIIIAQIERLIPTPLTTCLHGTSSRPTPVNIDRVSVFTDFISWSERAYTAPNPKLFGTRHSDGGLDLTCTPFGVRGEGGGGVTTRTTE